LVVVLRDVPEPALLIRRLDDERGALVAAGVAISALPIRPDGAFVEDGVPQAELEAILQHGALAAGVDDDFGPDFDLGAVLALNAGADGAGALEQHLQHARRFMDLDALLGRVAQHHQIELAAHDLPGLGALVRLVVPEVEGRRQLALGIDELHAVFLDEMALLHFVQHLEPLEHPIGLGNERLADMEAGKALALAEDDVAAVRGQERGAGAAGGAAADDEYVGELRKLRGHRGHMNLHARASFQYTVFTIVV